MAYGERCSRGAAKLAEVGLGARLDGITGAIIDASLHIHRDVGPRLLESVYEAVLARTMARQRFRVERQKAIRFAYDGMAFEEGQPSASSRLHVNQRVAAEPRGDGH
jgi:GxxExxY protein